MSLSTESVQQPPLFNFMLIQVFLREQNKWQYTLPWISKIKKDLTKLLLLNPVQLEFFLGFYDPFS